MTRFFGRKTMWKTDSMKIECTCEETIMIVIKIVLIELNVKWEKVLKYFSEKCKLSRYSNNNDRRQRIWLINAPNGLILTSTTFPLKNIQKFTLTSQDWQTMNQIDPVMIQYYTCLSKVSRRWFLTPITTWW